MFDFGNIINGAFEQVMNAFDGMNPNKGAYERTMNDRSGIYGSNESVPYAVNPFQGSFVQALLGEPNINVNGKSVQQYAFFPFDLKPAPVAKPPEGVLIAPRPKMGNSTPVTQSKPVSGYDFGTPIAQKYGLDPDVIRTLLVSEGGGVGDAGMSYGPLQFHMEGMLPAIASYIGTDLVSAAQYTLDHPEVAVDWALRPGGYLYNAIKNGEAKGLRGADLAVYASRYGQRSAYPDRLYSLYQKTGAQ